MLCFCFLHQHILFRSLSGRSWDCWHQVSWLQICRCHAAKPEGRLLFWSRGTSVNIFQSACSPFIAKESQDLASKIRKECHKCGDSETRNAGSVEASTLPCGGTWACSCLWVVCPLGCWTHVADTNGAVWSKQLAAKCHRPRRAPVLVGEKVHLRTGSSDYGL